MATTYLTFSPLDAIPAARTGHAPLEVKDGTGTGNPQHPILLFDASTEEVSQYLIPSVRGYGSGNWTVTLRFSMVSATSGNVVIGARMKALTSGDAVDWEARNFSTENTATVSVPATAGHVKDGAITLSNLDSVANGDIAVLQVARKAADGSDTASGDMELHGIEVSYSDT